MKSAGQRAVIWVGWGISLFFIGWAVTKMDLGKVWSAILMANYWWLIPSAIINMVILFVRSVRWTHFVAPIKEIKLISSVSALCIGYMANMVLPARIGEIVRAYVLARRESIPKSSAFGTVVIERAVDGLSVVVMMFILFAIITPPADQMELFNSIRLAGMTMAAFFITFFICLYLFHKQWRPVVWTLEKLTGLLPGHWGGKAMELLESFRQGFDSIDHGHRIMKIIFWSAVAWLLAGPQNYFIFQAFGLSIPFIGCYFVTLSQVFGVMIPSAPAFVGVFHAATIAGLMFYGVDSEFALSVALVVHAVYFVSFTLPGLGFLWFEQYSFSDISHAADSEEN